MKNFDTRTYSISDFLEWEKSGLLELSPDFQRRSVWSEKAKSFLIDTVLNAKPMPKIIITQKLQGAKNVRVVVDGQQRLRAIIDYFNDDFKMSRAHSKELSKHFYTGLPDDFKKGFLKYELGVDVLFDVPYADILDIFARRNSYTVKLEKQELFNATYLGYFKQHTNNLGLKYVSYFIEGGVLTKAKVSRMGETELAADFLIALLDEVQTNKNIESFYKKYEDVPGHLEDASRKFNKVMSFIAAIYKPEELKNTNWSRVHLFYTLFTSIAHLLFTIKGLDTKSHKQISEKSVGKVRIVLDNISVGFDEASEKLDDPDVADDLKTFIYYSRRGTTDTAARVSRANYVCKKVKSVL